LTSSGSIFHAWHAKVAPSSAAIKKDTPLKQKGRADGPLDNMDWAEPVGNIWSDSKAAWVHPEGRAGRRQSLWARWPSLPVR
jgi:hypothetical protein